MKTKILKISLLLSVSLLCMTKTHAVNLICDTIYVTNIKSTTQKALNFKNSYGYIEFCQGSYLATINTDRDAFSFTKPILITGQIGTLSPSDLSFATGPATSFTRLMLKSSGNVGIGTVSPTNRLDVAALNGEGIRIGKLGDGGVTAIPLNAQSAQLNIDFTGYRNTLPDQIGARISALRFNNWNAGESYIQKTGLSFSTNPSGIHAGITDLVERMRISPEGNIGIGTINPQYLLDVKGTIRATEIRIVSIDSIPDYVFESDYNLPKLTDVYAYIQANKHLPNVPSASEVKENGMNMVDMQVKMLRKVEELTLYVINQQKEIEELKQALAKAKN